MIQWLIPALTLGFLGSFHCIGMCGPIALSLPIPSNGSFSKIYHLLAYNIGRVVTYSSLGMVFGLIGQSFLLFGFQQYLSVIVGSIILLSVIFSFLPFQKGKLSGKVYAQLAILKNTLASLFKKKGIHSVFSIGLLNGLLPCGLVYMAIAGSVATGNYVHGAFFMAIFGLSTIPIMLSLSLLGNVISLQFRKNIQKAIPFVLSGMAILLILRGLNLGIPYISPKLIPANQIDHSQTINCHK
jgi:sulfite exporter TauE/SafE